jgi:hypothetical protein
LHKGATAPFAFPLETGDRIEIDTRTGEYKRRITA